MANHQDGTPFVLTHMLNTYSQIPSLVAKCKDMHTLFRASLVHMHMPTILLLLLIGQLTRLNDHLSIITHKAQHSQPSFGFILFYKSNPILGMCHTIKRGIV